MKLSKTSIAVISLAVVIVAVNVLTLAWYFGHASSENETGTLTETVTAEFFPVPDRILVYSPEKEVIIEKDDPVFAEIIKINESRVQPNWVDTMGGRGFLDGREDIADEKYIEYIYDNPVSRVYPYYNDSEHSPKGIIFHIYGEWYTCFSMYEPRDNQSDVYNRFGDLNASSTLIAKIEEILK